MTLEELKRMTRPELLRLARENKIRFTGQPSKAELVELLAAATKRTPSAGASTSKSEEIRRSVEKIKVLAAKRAAKQVISGARKVSRIKARPKAEEKRAAEEERATEESHFLVRPLAATAKPGAAPKAPAAKHASAAKAAAPKPMSAAKPAAQKGAAPKPPAAKPQTARAEAPKAAPAKAPGVKPAAPPSAAKPGAPAANTKAAGGAEKRAAKPAAKKRAARKPFAKRPAEEPRRPSDEAIRQQAEEGKYYLGAEQRVMPPVEAIEIPAGYNVDRIVALVRDPYWIFAYWEVTGHKFHELERHFGADWPQCKTILRVYDRTESSTAHFDIELAPGARNWYINVGAERRYQVAIGALSPDGRFEQIAISNLVETPSGRVSDRIDEEWMIPDDVFMKIFAASGGHDMHAASAELKELLARRLEEEISSGAVSSFGSGALRAPGKGRKFRLWVATELILYGGTEPDAHVTVQGKEVKLRADGTFSLRFALPDGKIDLPVTAVSADAVEERTIETDVTKKSNKKAPVLK